ncbi:MAG: hypothetical protein M1818_004846 [Claussenomyces sp. TS43310]|nr:MAG: hypothetical protein M1818_004846 [Claussenomyces sp. TS43310]
MDEVLTMRNADSRLRRDARREARNRNPLRYRSPVPALPADYSHIKLLAAPSTSRAHEEGTADDYFIKRKSLQDELMQQEEEGLQTLQASSKVKEDRAAPQSFAEAAAMNHSRARTSMWRDLNDRSPDPSTPVSLDSLKVAQKTNKKKFKKWTPLDLSSVDPRTVESPLASGLTSEVISEVASEVDGETTTLLQHSVGLGYRSEEVSPAAGQVINPFTLPLHGTRKEEACFTEFPHLPRVQTSSQTPLALSATALTSHGFIESPLPSPLHQKADSKSTTDKLDHIMSRIDEAFDVEEWDSQQPPAGDGNNSPEPLMAKPQTLTYTTVGSLVKSNSTPQFTPPVRIQREGAGRRPPQTAVVARGLDSYYSARKTPPQLGHPHMKTFNNSLPVHSYLGQPLQSPRNLAEIQKDSNLGSLGVSNSYNLNEEQEAYLRSLGVSALSLRHGNTSAPLRESSLQPRNDPFVADSLIEVTNMQVATSVKLAIQSTAETSTQQSLISGLDKMQTLQRLAGYPNPMQRIAKERLAEFATTKIENSPDMPAQVLRFSTPAVSAQTQMTGISTGQPGSDNEKQKKGSLDFAFRFPIPNSGTASGPNPLFTVFNQSKCSPKQSKYSQVPPGYPQPLTAGPPGQRPAASSNNKTQDSSFYSSLLTDVPQNGVPQHTEPQIAPCKTRCSQEVAEDVSGDTSQHGFLRPTLNSFRNVTLEGGHIHDTLSHEAATKYYRHGYPDDFSGIYHPLDDMTQNKFLLNPMTVASSCENGSDKWWYTGLMHLQKTAEDHCHAIETRGFHCDQRYPHYTAAASSERKVLTIGQIKAMSKPDIASTLLDNLFGTLISYADGVPGPNNKAMMSNFILAPAWAIDESPEGNRSVFGEDWGQPPKRLGRDPRYQGEHRSLSRRY